MLAEKKKKQKWCLNPRGKEWSEDANKFGQKLLERMGWSKGKGLGINENGITEHVKIAFKNDTKGMGFREDDNPWTENEVEYSKFLKRLSNQGYNSQLGSDGASDNSETNEIQPKVESLEKKSELSRTRVHYKKFTRGKDLSQYSSKDLACIFGKSTLSKQNQSSNVADDVTSSTDSANSDLGNNLIAGGCMDKYFENKMRHHKSKFEIRHAKSNNVNDTDVTLQDPQNESTDIESISNINLSKNESANITQCDSTVLKKQKKKKKSKDIESVTANYIQTETVENGEVEEPRKSKKKSKKHSKNHSKLYESGIDNPALNLNNSTDEIVETDSFDYSSTQIKNVKISKKVFSTEQQGIDNPALNLQTIDSSEIVPESTTTIFEVKRNKKKRKNELVHEVHEDVDEKPSSKKLKRDKHTELMDSDQLKVKKRKRNTHENNTDTPEPSISIKKKKKSKSHKDSSDNLTTMHGIENAALQLSSEDNSLTSPTMSATDVKKIKKKHKKDKHKTKFNKMDDISSIHTTENTQFGYENPAYNSPSTSENSSITVTDVNNVSLQSTPKSVLKKNSKDPSISSTTSTRKSVQINESMNQEKFITDSENSFSSTNTDDDSISKRIDNYQTELENALNEQKHETKQQSNASTANIVTTNATVSPPKDYTAQKFKYIALHHLAKGESTIAFPGVSIQRMISGYGSPKN